MDARTGRLIYGWAHCVQSMSKILLTELNERVQRNEFGGDLIKLIDRPENEETILDIYIASAKALEPRVVEGRQYGEPGFVLLRTYLDAGTPARVSLLLDGVFFENGHLGDFSNPLPKNASFVFSEEGGTFGLFDTIY
ncbi:baseplate assembly protein [Rhizobium sp. SSA_523]|uniref:baseplate assembly protein n=1 Tax=Rhizobium sp. SSA_523 TaxID=2952477 RepID=UPI002091DF74|nr:baseplate assembly protein [Rhizobium sp. SSA_523]MCO5730081.1 baseplate assembly protein [Rhizobium sp. SSA_523]WKC25146.1 baseplate assembly protein [Rhizobium sp. SSA_523]